MLKTYYVIRSGWNARNQSSLRSVQNPKNSFESKMYKLVAIVEASSEDEACLKAEKEGVSVYNNQRLFSVTNPRGIRGLTDAIRDFSEPQGDV